MYTVGAVAGLLLVAVFFVSYMKAPVNRSGGLTVPFTVNQGDGVQDVAAKLKDKKLIRSQIAFLFAAIGDTNSIYPGTYQLSQSMENETILKVIGTPPPKIRIVKILFKEGWTIGQYADAAAEYPMCSREEFMDIASDPLGSGIDTHGYDITHLEGFLFPATYEFLENATCEEVVQKLVDQFFKIVGDTYVNKAGELYRNLGGDVGALLKTDRDRDLFKAVTMASVVEKEARVAKERDLVAGVFYKRLKNNWKLECDATFKYLNGEWVPTLRKSSFRARSNPYNTYEITGLPPGPIGNPGKASLLAAVRPVETGYWYFVTKNNGSHEHFFSATFGQHQRAIHCSNRNMNSATPNCVP
jgi:UPF0755 protein